MSATYTVSKLCDAIVNADTYRMSAATTGNFSFIETVIDAELALEQAALTETQSKFIDLRLRSGLSQTECAEVLNVSQPYISMMEREIDTKLSKVIEKWDAEINA